jgi:hypothetical protein
MTSAADDLGSLTEAARKMVGDLPAMGAPRSVRRLDMRDVKGAVSPGGRTRGDIIGWLAADGELMLAHLSLLIDGAADCFAAADNRGGRVNATALTVVVRSALEAAGQIAWLFEERLSGVERARRWLTWCFDDVKQQRLLLATFRAGSDPNGEASDGLHRIEEELLRVTRDAGWIGRPSRLLSSNHFEPAAILGEDGRAEEIPTFTQLVGLVSSTPSIYPTMSAHAHSQRFGIRQGLERGADVGDGKPMVQVTAVGTPVMVNLALAGLAIDRPGRLLAAWNGGDSTKLHALALRILERSGIAGLAGGAPPAQNT